MVQAAANGLEDAGLPEGLPGLLGGVAPDQVMHHVAARPVPGDQAGIG